jgi:hypothetical protein
MTDFYLGLALGLTSALAILIIPLIVADYFGLLDEDDPPDLAEERWRQNTLHDTDKAGGKK